MVTVQIWLNKKQVQKIKIPAGEFLVSPITGDYYVVGKRYYVITSTVLQYLKTKNFVDQQLNVYVAPAEEREELRHSSLVLRKENKRIRKRAKKTIDLK